MNIFPVDWFAHHRQEIESLLQELVNIESPSTDKAAVDRLGQRIAREVRDLRGEVQVLPQSNAGDHMLCRWGQSGRGEGQVLLLAHMDTVFDLGTLAKRPYRQTEERLFGPGIQDMKASIAMLLSVVRVFQQRGVWPARPVTVLFTSDEETGSLTSRSIIEAEAARSAVVFCLEPALSNGALKTARKGTGDIELRVKGVAAHAGANHERGRNAIEELAHHILAAQKLTDYNRGTTVNVGVIRGGTRPNVVPDEASAEIDFRVTELAEFERLKAWATALTPVIDGTQVSAKVDLNRPPMPRDATMVRAFERAHAIALEMDLHLTEGSTGGGSDANFVAPLGIPVLDGLGAVGDGAHSENEFIWANSLAERAALLAVLLLNW